MALQAPVQRGPRQMRDRRLGGVLAVVQRQQRMPPERDDHRLFFDRQRRGLCVLRTGREIGHRSPALPLGDRLLVDPVAFRQSPQSLSEEIMLDCIVFSA